MARRDVSLPLDQSRQWSARRGAARTHTRVKKGATHWETFLGFFFFFAVGLIGA